MSTDRPIRVLHVTRIPRTVTTFLFPLLEAHRQRGDQVSVACTDAPEAAEIEAAGFPVHRFSLTRSLSPLNLSRAVWQLRRIVRRERIDWVFAHTPIASGAARVAALIGRARGTVYMAHGLPCAPQMPKSAWLVWYTMERLLSLVTRGIITMNRYDYGLARRRLLRRSPDRVFQVNGVGVDADALDRLCGKTDAAAVKQELGSPVDAPMLLLLARTVANKGIREYLEAARQLVEAGTSARFVLAGVGPLDAEIAAYIQRHRLEKNVMFLGWRNDAHRLMAACDIYVLPTYYPEGLPVSVLEAMGCGKPVVATQHRGCEDEVVDGVTGLLIPVRDSTALAGAIKRLLDDPSEAKRLGEAGRRRIDEHYRIEQTTAATLAAFDRIIA